jgi:hypothetical protein
MVMDVSGELRPTPRAGAAESVLATPWEESRATCLRSFSPATLNDSSAERVVGRQATK